MKIRIVVAAALASALCACGSKGAGSAPTPSPLPVATGSYPMHGHASDYAWIAGTVKRDLTCIYLDVGAPRRSPWAGRIALVGTPEMLDELRQGDAVVIKGELSRLADGACGAPSYTIASIEEH